MTRFDKDFLGNEINIGDKVIFEAPGYRSFAFGTVMTKAEKTCQIQYINNWNFPDGATLIVRQAYDQLIKYPDANAIPKEECRRCGKAANECIVKLQELLANARVEIEFLKEENEGLAAEVESEHLSRMDNIRQLNTEIEKLKSENEKVISEFAKALLERHAEYPDDLHYNWYWENRIMALAEDFKGEKHEG